MILQEALESNQQETTTQNAYPYSIKPTTDKYSHINTEYYHNLTLKLLDRFYPKYCTHCNTQLTQPVKNRPESIRCKVCHEQQSRLSYTPLHHYKLPIWTFGYILAESMYHFPSVLTAKEISKRLLVTHKTSLLLTSVEYSYSAPNNYKKLKSLCIKT